MTTTARAVRAQPVLPAAAPTAAPGTVSGHYQLALATSEDDVRAAQRLRHRVFGDECGAAIPGAEGIDRDDFDDRCDHVIVWYTPGAPTGVDEPGWSVTRPRTAVATNPLLPPHANDIIPRGAGLRSHTEFGLMPLEPLLDSAVEAGRSCVHPDHRNGAAVSLLWRGVARYLHLTGYRYVLGCASIDLRDGGGNAAAFWDLARDRHLAPSWHRCRPRRPLPIGGLSRAERPVVPPPLAGYLRLGAVVCGPPAWDTEFGTADFLVLLDMQRLDRRYLRHDVGEDSP